MASGPLKIGDLARRTGSPVETIRYYEREKLLPAPMRSGGNYRLYGAAHVERLQFIRHCRSLDMTLDEIRVLLSFRDAPDASCDAVNALLDQHIAHVANRLRELQELQTQLTALRSRCQTAHAARDCEILQSLGSADGGVPAHRRTQGSGCR